MDINTFTKGIYTAKAHTRQAGNGQFEGYVILTRDEGDIPDNTVYDSAAPAPTRKKHSTRRRRSRTGFSAKSNCDAQAASSRRRAGAANGVSPPSPRPARQASLTAIDTSIVISSADMNGNG